MLAAFTVGLLSFTTPSPLSRREALAMVAGSFAVAAPLPAFAQRSALVPKSSAESTASFKAYQLSQPGEATPEFIEAEKKRNAAAAKLAANPNARPAAESAEETMARLGLKTMVQAEAAGYDQCATWRGCNRN